MLWLVVLFAILAIIFGFWGFGAAAGAAWAGAKVLFWVWIILLILAFIGGSWRGWGYRGPPV